MKQFERQLISDLYAEYKRIKDANTELGIFEQRLTICKRIASLPAPRFYISVHYLERIIKEMSMGYYRAKCNRFRKHHELYKRWLSLPDEKKNKEGLIEIINQPAPSYYVGADRINRLLYKYIKL